MAYYLGIDIGTSSTKALVTSARLRVLSSATVEHPTETPGPLWSQQHPSDWWASTIKAVRKAVAKAKINGKDISAIGLSGQMHALVVTDATGQPLRPAIIWNDQRSAKQAAQVEAAVGGTKKLIALVGSPAMTSYTLTKLLWVRQNEPKVYDRIKHMLLPKDYIRLRLTGEYIGDVSDMSGTLLLDQVKRDWSRKMTDLFQIDRDILPPVVESHEVTGRLRPDAAGKLGLQEGTPVVAGAGDQLAGAVGNGIVSAGLVSATMGTSGVVLMHSRRYKTDPQAKVNTFCAAVAGEYCMFGCVLSAGGSLQWFRNVLAAAETASSKRRKVDTYEMLDTLAAQAPAGCEGLFWLPYLTGERTPHADPMAKACWIGIHAGTDKSMLIRSVIEGATFAMKDVLTLMAKSSPKVRNVRLSGGGARSSFWRQLQADIYGVTCTTMNTDEGPGYGAALLSAVGTGRFGSVREACTATIRVARTVRPRPAQRRLYQKYYDEYRRLYPALKQHFAIISELVG